MANENADNINSTDAAGNAGAEEVQVQLIDGVCVVTAFTKASSPLQGLKLSLDN